MSTVTSQLDNLAGIGRDRARGGYSRLTYSGADLELREWFTDQARQRSLDVETDRNGIVWAWRPGRAGSLTDAVVTGSHLDSVPGGGAFDGPLGIASAFAAADLLDERGLLGTAGGGPVPGGGRRPVRGRLPGLPPAHRGDQPAAGPGPDRRRRGDLRRG